MIRFHRYRLFAAFCLITGTGLMSCLKAAPYEAALDGGNAKVTIRTPFENLPSEGAIPFEVEIENNRDQAGTWNIKFEGDNIRDSFVSASYDFTVEAHATNKFSVALPLAIKSSYSWLSIQPVLSGNGVNTDAFPPVTLNRGGGPAPLLSVFSNTLHSKVDWAAETTDRQTRGKTAFFESGVNPAALPSDWKGLTGVGSLLLTDTDWLGLRSEQRQAILDYVAMGGRLGIFVSGQTASKPESLELPIDVSGSLPSYPNYGYRLGIGFIGLEDKRDFSDSYLEFFILTGVRTSLLDTAHTYVDSTWSIGDAVGKVLVNAPLIILIVVLFSTLVGPVNLIYFAPSNKRIRLFWTTPVISLGASALLFFGILIVDGLGGKGRQAVVIYSVPKLHQELVLQEQASRTAVLVSTDWKNVDDALVYQIPQFFQNNGYGNTDPGTDDKYFISGQNMSGSWFKSRSIAWQYLRLIRSTRSCLTIMNLKEVEAGKESPKIVSSFPVTLTEAHLSVGDKCWVAHSILPGQPTDCTTESNDKRKAFFDDCRGHVGQWLKDAIQEPENSADPVGISPELNAEPSFIATAEPDDRQVIPTLSAIKWQVDQQVYLGTIVDQQVEEGTHDR